MITARHGPGTCPRHSTNRASADAVKVSDDVELDMLVSVFAQEGPPPATTDEANVNCPHLHTHTTHTHTHTTPSEDKHTRVM